MVTILKEDDEHFPSSIAVIPRSDLAPDEILGGYAVGERMLLGYGIGSRLSVTVARPEHVYFFRNRHGKELEHVGILQNWRTQNWRTYEEVGIPEGKFLLSSLIPYLEKTIQENTNLFDIKEHRVYEE